MFTRTSKIFCVIAVIACALLAVGCGGCGNGNNADPAKATPPGVALYVNFTINPSGQVKTNAEAALSKVLNTKSPSTAFQALLGKIESNEKVKQGGTVRPIDFKLDIQPWLGAHAAVWADFAGKHGVLLVFAVKDSGKAQSFLTGLANNGQSWTKNTYKGVTYYVHGAEAYALSGNYFFAGGVSELQKSIDALKSGNSLASDSYYTNTIKTLPTNSLAQGIVNPIGIVQAVGKNSSTLSQLQPFFGGSSLSGPIGMALIADGSRVAVLFQTPQKASSSTPASTASETLIKTLPGDAWFAAADANFGNQIRGTVKELAAGPGATAFQFLQQNFGLNVNTDIASWIGSLEIFAVGTTPADIGGAIILTTNNDKAAAAGFSKISGLLSKIATSTSATSVPGAQAATQFKFTFLPSGLIFARGPGKVVIAYGKKAASEAFSAPTTLANSPLIGQAEAALTNGIKPSAILSVPQLFTAIKSFVPASSQAELAVVQSYLGSITVIAAGGLHQGKVENLEIAAGLK